MKARTKESALRLSNHWLITSLREHGSARDRLRFAATERRWFWIFLSQHRWKAAARCWWLILKNQYRAWSLRMSQ